MFYKLPVKKVMVEGPLTVQTSTSIIDAVDIMKQYNINSLLIKSGEDFVGIVTDVDMVKKGLSSGMDVRSTDVSQIMTSPILTIDENEPIDHATDKMTEHHIRHLVVTSKNKPVGVVSVRDLMDPVYEEDGGVPFWPNHLLKEVVAVFIMLGVLFTLIIYSPAPMEPLVDPFTTPVHIKPEWYFLAAYQFLKVAEILSFISNDAPKVIGVLAQGVVVMVLFLLPFIDKNKERSPKKRRGVIMLGIISLFLFFTFTIWGHFS